MLQRGNTRYAASAKLINAILVFPAIDMRWLGVRVVNYRVMMTFLNAVLRWWMGMTRIIAGCYVLKPAIIR
jgi:hypothetical protein